MQEQAARFSQQQRGDGTSSECGGHGKEWRSQCIYCSRRPHFVMGGSPGGEKYGSLLTQQYPSTPHLQSYHTFQASHEGQARGIKAMAAPRFAKVRSRHLSVTDYSQAVTSLLEQNHHLHSSPTAGRQLDTKVSHH